MILAILLTVASTWLVWMPLRYRYLNRGNQALTLLYKAIPTLMAAGFAGFAVYRNPAPEAYADLVLIGLLICAGADVLLEIRFEIGGFLFFSGHVLYVLALSLYRPLSWWCLTAFALAAVCLEYFLSHYIREVSAKTTVIGLRIYALALAALLGFSLPLPFLAFSGRSVLAALGAALFAVSDLTLCHNTIRKKPQRWHMISLGVYYTGQLLLGLSALHLF